MTARYSASAVAGAASSGAAYAAMMSGATTVIAIRSLTLTTRTAVAGEFALERSFAVGTGTSVASGISHRDLAPASVARLETAWSSSPTGTAKALRRFTVGAATGTRVDLWREEDGPLVVEPSKALLLKNVASGAGPALDVSFTWEEGPRSDA